MRGWGPGHGGRDALRQSRPVYLAQLGKPGPDRPASLQWQGIESEAGLAGGRTRCPVNQEPSCAFTSDLAGLIGTDSGGPLLRACPGPALNRAGQTKFHPSARGRGCGQAPLPPRTLQGLSVLVATLWHHVLHNAVPLSPEVYVDAGQVTPGPCDTVLYPQRCM